MSRRAKIVCTLGPAASSPEQVTALIESGMDVARLNFSHGAHADHATAYERVRAASDRTGHAVAVLADLQGPKIRLGTFADGPVTWVTGSQVVVTVDDVEGTVARVSTTYKNLAADARVGDRLLVDDGKLALTVVAVEGPDVICLVVEGGEVSNNKGLSLPGVAVSVPALSDKDEEDLRFALHLGVDFIALSFVRHPDDAELVREIMRQEDIEVPVIAKLEKPEAVERLDAIVEAFDGIMVARGDLGVELPLEQVPLVQKRAIQAARERNKPVIVATQMLESMIVNSRPTRAEASDVANAVLDGADAVMLSGETSVGAHPIGAVRTMERIIDAVETEVVGVPELQRRSRSRSGARSCGRPRTSARPSRSRRWPRSRRPARPPAGWPPCTPVSRCWPSPSTRGSAASWRCPGAWRRSWCPRCRTPTTWWRRSTSRCCPSAGSRWATASSSSPGARPTRSAPPT
jgi:pyruvate kinase